MQRLTAGILIFDDVEVLDFAGPFEVLSRARLEPGLESRRSDESAPFDVFTVAERAEPVTAVGGLRVEPHHSFTSTPRMDVLIVPGGFGVRPLLERPAVLGWVVERARQARQLASVCTGSLLLARAGLLRGRRATTHWGSHERLAALDPSITVEPGSRVVEDGVVTSAGVAAGMDMAFTLVARFCGEAVARDTARYIEYPWPGLVASAPAAAEASGA